MQILPPTKDSSSPRAASFADIIKYATMVTKATFKGPQKTKQLEVIYANAIYICISWYNKSCWFPVKKCWCWQYSRSVSRNLYTFWIFFRQGITVRFHQIRICVRDFRKRELFTVQPWATPKRTILKRIKNPSYNKTFL